MIHIVVSIHAVGRMRERFPGRPNPEAMIRREVAAAIEAGRRSKNRPRWASVYKVGKGGQSTRFVWNEPEIRCYVITEKRIQGGRGYLVVTVLARQPDHEAKLEARRVSMPDAKQTRTGKHAPRGERAPKYKGWEGRP